MILYYAYLVVCMHAAAVRMPVADVQCFSQPFPRTQRPSRDSMNESRCCMIGSTAARVIKWTMGAETKTESLQEVEASSVLCATGRV